MMICIGENSNWGKGKERMRVMYVLVGCLGAISNYSDQEALMEDLS